MKTNSSNGMIASTMLEFIEAPSEANLERIFQAFLKFTNYTISQRKALVANGFLQFADSIASEAFNNLVFNKRSLSKASAISSFRLREVTLMQMAIEKYPGPQIQRVVAKTIRNLITKYAFEQFDQGSARKSLLVAIKRRLNQLLSEGKVHRTGSFYVVGNVCFKPEYEPVDLTSVEPYLLGGGGKRRYTYPGLKKWLESLCLRVDGKKLCPVEIARAIEMMNPDVYISLSSLTVYDESDSDSRGTVLDIRDDFSDSRDDDIDSAELACFYDKLLDHLKNSEDGLEAALSGIIYVFSRMVSRGLEEKDNTFVCRLSEDWLAVVGDGKNPKGIVSNILNTGPTTASYRYNRFLEIVDNCFLCLNGFRKPESSPKGRKIADCRVRLWNLKVLYESVMLLAKAVSPKGNWL